MGKKQKIGVLITHGTDTMAWTHAYLKYAIKHLPFSIAITGAQLPISDEFPYSDGYQNIKSSIQFLSKIKTPSIFSVFNAGEIAFSDSLMKIRKWHNNAFIGDKMLTREWDEIKLNLQNVKLEKKNKKLDWLFVVTTGGTISSQKDKFGMLTPIRDTVNGYISKYLGSYFQTKSKLDVFSKDSSDITFENLKTMVEQIKNRINSQMKEPIIQIDTMFSKKVKIIYLDPFYNKDDYEKLGEGYHGIILAGYGGGNVNLEMLDLIKKWNDKDKIVVLSSQVPIGVVDIVYKNAYEPIKAGAISSVDLSLIETKLRLSYLLGHENEIKKYNLGQYSKNLKTLFLSGVKFRTTISMKRHFYLSKIPYIKDDIIYNKYFEESLKLLEQYI